MTRTYYGAPIPRSTGPHPDPLTDFLCDKCEDTGLIGVRNTFPMSYVGPGPVPDYARGVCEARCNYCDPVARFQEECDDE